MARAELASAHGFTLSRPSRPSVVGALNSPAASGSSLPVGATRRYLDRLAPREAGLAGRFTPIPWVFAEVVRALVPGERVRVEVNDRLHEDRARRILQRAAPTWAR
jgi:hypothetical protein